MAALHKACFLLLLVATTGAAGAAVNDAAKKAYGEVNDRMMADMMKPMSGDPDMDFVMMMLPHHQGAVDMAKVELQYGQDPELKKLAQDIVSSQEKEIAFMTAWNKKHGM